MEQTENKLSEAFVKGVLGEYTQEKISFGKMVELLNEAKVHRPCLFPYELLNSDTINKAIDWGFEMCKKYGDITKPERQNFIISLPSFMEPMRGKELSSLHKAYRKQREQDNGDML